ncbi:Acyl carrier protein 2, mitochondrial [Dichanthelium oligosanthes]|uniref:Acyl carrier protein n=1 Tax=Dichanthelium oligosanthes TaxID=888268 RepID=A0A1E5WHL9_9POAL|nr:Acyl carrier protein 2, mitochondrial [Dichanthelium oligosanthes]
MAAARSLILRHLRLAAAPSSAASFRPAAALQEALWGRRWMSSEEAKGSFLDKSEVTDRIIKVVRGFQKIDDPSKPIGLWLWGALVSVGVVCPGMMEMMTLVSLHGAVEDSYQTRGNLLDNSEVKLISFHNANILKDLLWKPPLNFIEFHRLVKPDAHFKNDLGLDSLDTVEVVMALEDEFGFEIPDNEADKIDSIKVAADFIASHPQAK